MHRTARAPTRIDVPARARFDEAGPDGTLRPSGLLRYVQDVAWIHSEGAGFGRDWYGARGLMWLVRSVVLDVLRPVEYGAALSVSTEVVGFRRVWARRLSEIRRDQDHAAVGGGGRLPEGDALDATVEIDWVLLGPLGAPTRVPPEILGAFPIQLPSFAPARVVLPPPEGKTFRRTFGVSRRDLDPMAHVNNAVYLDYLEESVELAGGADLLAHLPRRYRLEYVLPAEPGAQLTAETARSDNGWTFRLTDGAERELFRGTVERVAT